MVKKFFIVLLSALGLIGVSGVFNQISNINYAINYKKYDCENLKFGNVVADNFQMISTTIMYINDRVKYSDLEQRTKVKFYENFLLYLYAIVTDGGYYDYVDQFPSSTIYGSCSQIARFFSYLAKECGYDYVTEIDLKDHFVNELLVGNTKYIVDPSEGFVFSKDFLKNLPSVSEFNKVTYNTIKPDLLNSYLRVNNLPSKSGFLYVYQFKRFIERYGNFVLIVIVIIVWLLLRAYYFEKDK